MIEIEEPRCVQMKHEIQAKLAEEFSGMSDEEIRRVQKRRIEANPVFGALSGLWKSVSPKAEGLE